MLVVAHAGAPVAPHDAWQAWNVDPVLLGLLLATMWAYRRGREAGRRPRDRRRDRLFGGALVVLLVALVSPLEAVAGSLASAHMVQHVLLLLVVAPLLALAAPSSVLLRGSPPGLRRATVALRRGVRPVSRRLAWWGAPVVAWLAHLLVVWGWHSAVLYEAALASEALHVLEHVSFVVTGVVLWRVVVGARGGAHRVAPGLGVLVVFATAMQGVFLSALLTFANEPWYPSYTTTEQWGLTALADQHLAGVIMWIPGSVVYVGVALTLLVRWLQALDTTDDGPGSVPGRPSRLATLDSGGGS